MRAVAERHGGSVEVGESATGGARFSVRFPMAHVLGEQPASAPVTA